MTVNGTFAGGTEMSGMASTDGQHFVFASNETRSAQMATVDFATHQLTVGESLSFPFAPGEAEMDLEAVACDPASKFYYVVGSHSVSKKKAKIRAEQLVCFKFKTSDSSTLKEYSIGSLSGIFKATPGVSEYYGQPLQQGGVNVEGLAFWKGKLWVGMRGPMAGEQALILEMPEDAPFSVEPMAAIVHHVSVGKNMGVRDLAPTKDGLVIIAGETGGPAEEKFPASAGWDGDKKFALWYWPGPAQPTQELAKLPKEKGSAEGIYTISETTTEFQFLLIHDGQANGAPKVMTVPKPPTKPQ